MSFYAFYPVKGGGGGVPIYVNLAAFPATATTGSLGVAADTGDLYEFNGTSWVLIAGPAFGTAMTSIGTIDTGTPSANGAQDLTNQLILQSASATLPGLVNNTTQTFSGTKTLTGALLTGSTAVTQALTDASSLVATDQFVNTFAELTNSTRVLNVGIAGSGTFSSAGIGTGAIIVYSASGGSISGIITIANPGSGYAIGDLCVATPGNDDAVFRVSGVSGGGITAVQIVYGGTGYSGIGATGPLRPTSGNFVNIFELSGLLTGNVVFLMTPGTYLTNSRTWIVNNNTTGPFTVTYKLSGQSGGISTNAPIGTGVVIPQGTNNSTPIFIECDGVNDIWYADTPLASRLIGSVSLSTQASGTLQAAQFPALTGDITTTAGSLASTLATVNSNVGSFTNANITVNAKGLITAAANGSSGTVTSVSVVSANGFAGTVATATSTPAITISTSINSPVLAGNGTAISAATTTGTGSTVVLATSPTLVTPALGTPSSGTLTSCSGLPVGGIAAIASDTLVGNNTGGSASPTALTVSQVNTMLGTLSNPMTTLGDIIYENATPAPARLAGNTTTATQFLAQTGTGSISAAPAWTTAIPVANGGTGNTSGGMLGTNTVAYTPTFTGLGTPSGVSCFWHRSGDHLIVQGTLVAGTPTATLLTVSLPSGLVIDSATPKISSGVTAIGSAAYGTNGFGGVMLASPSQSTAAVYFGVGTSGQASATPQNGNAIVGSGNSFSFTFTVPIVGWNWNS